MSPILVVLVSILVITYGVGMTWWLRRRIRSTNETLKRMAAQAGATGQGSGKGDHQGAPFEYRYSPGGRNSPPSFTVLIPNPSPLRLRVRKELPFDRFFKRLGLAVEVQTGDRRFDEAFYVATDQPELVRELLSRESVRANITALFDLGYTVLSFGARNVEAAWVRFKPDQHGDAALVSKTVRALAQLAAETPAQAPRRFVVTGWRWRRGMVLAVPVVLDVAGGVGIAVSEIAFEPLDRLEILWASLAPSLPLLAAYIVASLRLLRGRSTSHVEWMVAAALACTAFPLAGYGLRASGNGWLDASAPVAREVRVVDRYANSEDSAYYLYLASWRRPGGTEKISVDFAFYRTAARAKAIEISTHPGYFGHEWIAGHRVAGGDAGGAKRSRLGEAWQRSTTGDYAGALLAYNAIAAQEPDNARVFYYRGALYGKTGRYDESLADMRRAIELDPHYWDAHVYIDWLLARQGKWDEIIAYWDRLIAREPNNARAYLERGGTYHHKGDRLRAREDVEHACRMGHQQACGALKRYY